MRKPGGIIYGMLALFRWSAKYPNARLAFLGWALWFMPIVMVFGLVTVFKFAPSSQSSLEALQIVLLAFQFICVACVVAGTGLILFAGRRAHWWADRDRRQASRTATTPPAPNPDARPDSDDH